MKFAADFETTTDENDCRVWAYAICEIGDPDNFIFGNNIDEFMEWCANPAFNHKIWFHNLKFDGEFILNWLFRNGFEYKDDRKECGSNCFTTLITSMGQFYSIEVYFKKKGHKTNKVVFYDSLKILNFSVDHIAKDFNLPISKLKIDYKAKREEGHVLTQEEIDYIRNDVEIMSRALNIMFEEGLTKMTIGSDALSDYKETNKAFSSYFPVLDFEIDQDIRQSYKGGFTYLNPIYAGKEVGKGIVFDVNSMYPAKMVSCRMPIGDPLFFDGKYEDDYLYDLYVQRLNCSFELKSGKIPSIQLKNNLLFRPNEYIESSGGDIVSLTLTSVDLELFLDNYNVEHLTFDGGWKFKSSVGMFTNYINKWTEKKIEAKKANNSALYRIAKLMLNSLYGKFGTSPISRKKIPFLQNGAICYALGKREERKSIYIPVASFITSYARKYIIESSQIIREYSLKKYGEDRYVYSDTDSIHCLLSADDVEELSEIMEIDDYKLGAWKLESEFERGKFIRQKCYIEEFDGVINATVAGLPKKLGKLITFENFDLGFTTEGMVLNEHKLTYSHVKGGVVLKEVDFTIK